MTGSSLATWRGSPNHYNGRNGYRVDHITLHIMVGTLESCANWFSLPQSQAASHYGVGPDRIYQFVDEDNGSWADANMASDCSGITIEHQGGIEGVPVTDAEVELSARLCADISRRYRLRGVRAKHSPRARAPRYPPPLQAREARSQRTQRQRVPTPRNSGHRPLRLPGPHRQRPAR